MDSGGQGAATSVRSQLLIEGDELEALLKANPSDLKIVNGTWQGKEDVAGNHAKLRIGNDSVHYNHDEICIKDSGLPHTMPTLEIFKANMVKLGIQKNHQIVCYDAHPLGMLCVARCAFMLKYFGATNVRILNGGLKKWMADGRPVVENTPLEEATYNEADGDYSYSVVDPSRMITNIGDVHKLVGQLHNAESAEALDFQIVDARPPNPFQAGNIKKSINLTFLQLLNEDGTLKTDEEIAKIYQDAGVSTEKTTINTCGEGIAACITDISQQLLGVKQTVVYDGSWAEYGSVEEPQF